ncbi:hypothetical protein QNJ24_04295 [Macrococcus caseolyticus]|uniref:Uncharacterized protein n=1 Tax=Macrococcus psychrotolerans TaxID=3039389 RepID=A0AAT9P349_9STAP|nr:MULTISPECIES: hypothetical protein [Macrococcus]MDJ1112497.1 hypothetical protein [Macrococcus sp. S115]MDJ1155314.1 hypothetical protein [Macrococcus caseolyticus]QYA32546.1 hypothetical protein KYI10_09400 [Macrococcus sp. 19Msa1099]QYA37357.1 hypothetical protein KYI07_09390 [Macrococcus caseolyticus]QYA76064.1 hypothetical protein KYI12_09390 [Macrococcus caseolyticus]
MRTIIILLLLLIIPLPLYANELPPTILYFENEHAQPLKYHFTVNDDLYYETDDDGYYIFNNTVNEIEVDGQIIPIKVGHKHIIHVDEPVDGILEEVPRPHDDETEQPSNNDTTVRVFTPAFTPSEAVHVYLNEGHKRIATSEAKDGTAHFDNLKRDTVYTATTDEAVEPIRIKQGETRRITVQTDDPPPKVRAARVMPQNAPEKQKLNIKLNDEADEEQSNKEQQVQKKYTYTKRSVTSQENNNKAYKGVMPQIPVSPVKDDESSSYNVAEQYESPIQKESGTKEITTQETTSMHPEDHIDSEYKVKQTVDKTLPDTGDAYTNPLLLSVLFTAYGGCILYISRLI